MCVAVTVQLSLCHEGLVAEWIVTLEWFLLRMDEHVRKETVNVVEGLPTAFLSTRIFLHGN